jgi:type VI secretion system protein VasG
LPDKAISLLDTACARVAMSLQTPPPVVDHLRHKIAALHIELNLLKAEGAVAQSCEERNARVAIALALCTSTELELAIQEARWKRELEIVESIRTQRTEQTQCAAECRAPSRQLLELEQELAALQQDAPLVFSQVDEAVVAAVLADWTGIPVGRMVRDEVSAVFQLAETLNKRVIGQDDALSAIAERVQVSRARLTDPGKPVGVFLLVGPSGVGKTETALALAEAMYGGEQNLITINMSEFQESHTVSTLKGAPPGYVGYGEGGVLTEAVRRKPYSVILLDEVEKAHPDVHEIFYQVFDKGWMEDGEGRQIDFRNTTILLTSNTGSNVIAGLCDGIAPMLPMTTLREALQPELRKVFPAAFLGRLSVVPYLPLDESDLSHVVAIHLDRIVERMKEQHRIELVYSSTLPQFIIDRCGTHETGARRLISFIEHNLLPVLAKHWLDALQGKRQISRIRVNSDQTADPHEQGGQIISCQIEYPHALRRHRGFRVARRSERGAVRREHSLPVREGPPDESRLAMSGASERQV